MKKLWIILLMVVIILPINSNWIATKLVRQQNASQFDAGRLRARRRFDYNNLEYKVNRLLENVAPEARAAVSQSLGLTGERTSLSGENTQESNNRPPLSASALAYSNDNPGSFVIVGGQYVGSGEGKGPGGGQVSPTVIDIPAGGSPRTGGAGVGNIQPQPE